jgi:GTP pyrophosphokinase
MKTLALRPEAGAAPILQIAESAADVPLPAPGAPETAGAAELARARAFAEPLLAAQQLDTGEGALAHADGVAAILQAIGAAPSMRASAYLVYAGDFLQRPDDVVRKAFGDSYASLVEHTRKLVQIQRAAREASVEAERRELQTERVRKMLLAFSRDLRVVLLRLASRLQTLRWFAVSKTPCPAQLALESLQVFAPLANRLGIWQIKWELEDLAFRFLQPAEYAALARQLDETRAERERAVEAERKHLNAWLRDSGVAAEVQGRPKHLYSIWKKMQGKQLGLSQIFDLRALRVIVADVQLPDGFVPLGRDGEVEHFICMRRDQVEQALERDEFTVEAGLSMREFLGRMRSLV